MGESSSNTKSWFEDIEKDEWSDRFQWYLGEFLNRSEEKVEDK